MAPWNENAGEEEKEHRTLEVDESKIKKVSMKQKKTSGTKNFLFLFPSTFF